MIHKFRFAELASSLHAPTCHVLAWFPVAVLGIYLKHVELTKQYLPIARSMGRNHGDDLSFLEKLTFFRLDILVCLVAIPLILVGVLHFLAPKFRNVMVIALSIVFALLFFMNFQSLGNIGRYISLDLIQDSVNWALSEPWFITQYIEPSAFVKLAVLMAMIVIGALPWGLRSPRYAVLSWEYLRKWKLAAFVAVVSMSILLSTLAWLPHFPVFPQHGKPAIQTALFSLLQHEGVSEFTDIAPDRVVSAYREFTRSPEPKQWQAFAGREAASDVIFFVFETGPSRALDLTRDLEDFPNLATLRERAFVAERHHSTYPYTSDALYSIFTSYYSAHARSNVVKRNSKMLNAGVFWALRDAGYSTSLHAPSLPVFENDDKMFKGLGVDRQFYAQAEGLPSSAVAIRVRQEMDRISPRLKADTVQKERLEEVLTLDHMALESVTREIAKNKTNGKRFATAFLPQIGHGPWLDIENNGNDYPARGRSLMALQDRWLGALLNTLRRNSWLNNTIIVVTSDHGIRTKKEDSQFNGGMISDYSFGVPLLIFAPNTLTKEKRIPWVTSHIDIAPSVLDLIGVGGDRRFDQGTVVWDPRLTDRITFFHAKGYLGADGFHDNGRFYMMNHLFGSVYGNHELDFSADNLVSSSGPEYSKVRETIEFMRNFQVRWGTLRDR